MKYELYQIKDVEQCPYAFMSLDYACKKGFCLADYAKVSEGTVNDSVPTEQALEDLFAKYNIAHPEGYKGRSMSVSDIVAIGEDKYYCDSFGFVKLN